MPTQHQTDSLYIDLAKRVAAESYCIKRKVGCVILTKDLITLIGYNGTKPGTENICEFDNGLTNENAIHAEENAINKSKKYGIDLTFATCYVTRSPCIPCARMLIDKGINRVVYRDKKNSNCGLTLLQDSGIIVERFNE